MEAIRLPASTDWRQLLVPETRRNYSRAPTDFEGLGREARCSVQTDGFETPEVLLHLRGPDLDTIQSRVQAKEASANLIRQFEGLRLTAYWDVSRWSIGYGTKSFEGETITLEEAERRLNEEIVRLFDAISKKCTECTTNHLASLISFAYNVGLGGLFRSSLFRYTLAGEHERAAGEFEKWVNAGGEKLEGLKKRREKERRVYLGQAIEIPD